MQRFLQSVPEAGGKFFSSETESDLSLDTRCVMVLGHSDAGAYINTPNIGNSALIIEELDWGGQDALNTCENSFFGPHLGLGRKKNVIRLGQTPDVKLPY